MLERLRFCALWRVNLASWGPPQPRVRRMGVCRHPQHREAVGRVTQQARLLGGSHMATLIVGLALPICAMGSTRTVLWKDCGGG